MSKLNKKLHLSSSLFILPTVFLCLFQLFVAILSTTNVPFSLNILFAVASAILLSSKITSEFSETIQISIKQLLLATLLILMGAFLILLRTNVDIYDFLNLTNLLSVISQIAEGTFPASYLSFPEITMNYHHGFTLLAGILVALTNLPTAFVVKVLLASFFALLQFGLFLLFMQMKNRYYYLPPLLFFLIGSANISFVQEFFKLSYYNELFPVGMITASLNSTWSFALPVLVTLFFVAQKFNDSPKHLLYTGILVLTLSTIHALLFQLTLAVILSLYGLHLASLWKDSKKITIPHIELVASLFIALLLIPRYIPSAFQRGSEYASPTYSIKFLGKNPEWYFTESLQYLLLAGFLPILILTLSVFVYRKYSNDTLAKLLTVGLLLCLFLPLLLQFNGVIQWEVLHKLAIASMFLSILLAIIYLEKLPKLKVPLMAVLIVSSFTSVHIVSSDLSFDFTSYNQEPAEMHDVVDFLSIHKTLLTPYKPILRQSDTTASPTDLYQGNEEYSLVAQYSNNFLRNHHHIGFLVNSDRELYETTEGSWKDFDSKLLSVKEQLNSGETLIVAKSKLYGNEREKIESQLGKPTEFEHYLLYRTQPW